MDIFPCVYTRSKHIPPSPKNSRPFVRLVHEGHIRGWNTLESCQPTNFRVQGKIPLRTWSEESLGNGGFAGGNETLSPLPHVTLHSCLRRNTRKNTVVRLATEGKGKRGLRRRNKMRERKQRREPVSFLKPPCIKFLFADRPSIRCVKP